MKLSNQEKAEKLVTLLPHQVFYIRPTVYWLSAAKWNPKYGSFMLRAINSICTCYFMYMKLVLKRKLSDFKTYLQEIKTSIKCSCWDNQEIPLTTLPPLRVSRHPFKCVLAGQMRLNTLNQS